MRIVKSKLHTTRDEEEIMHHDDCICRDNAGALRTAWITETAARPRDRYNLPKPIWREMLKALFAPAVRLHRYRDLRTSMFRDAVCELDCGEERVGSDD